MKTKSKVRSEIPDLRRRLEKIENSIKKWIQSFESDRDSSLVAIDRIKQLEVEREEIKGRLENLRLDESDVPSIPEISNEHLTNLLEKFETAMSMGDIADKRELLSKIIKKIEIGEKLEGSQSRGLVLHPQPETTLRLVTPRGFEPLFQA